MRREDRARTWVVGEVNRRRRDAGFPQDVPRECWRDADVARAATAAVERLLPFPAAEWDDLADEAEGDLCEALDDVNAALNALTLYWPGVQESRQREAPAAGVLPHPAHLLYRKRDRGGHSTAEDGAVPVDSDSRRCGEALGEFLAWQMSQDALVSEFRRNALSDRLFDDEARAWEFLTSQLIQVTPLKMFKEYGLCPATAVGRVEIPPLYHGMLMNITIIGKLEGETDGVRKIMIEVPAEMERPDDQPARTVLKFPMSSYMCVGYTPYRTELPVNVMVSSESPEFSAEPNPIPFFAAQGVDRFVEGLNDSVTCEAMHVGHHLTGLFPIHIWDALCFLLTGTLSWLQGVRSVRANYDPYILVPKWRESAQEWDYDSRDLFSAAGPHCLYVQPWVQPEELAEYWRRVRPASAPRTPPKERSLALFRFALKNTPPGESFRWEVLAGQWAAETGETMTRNQMQMTFKRVREALLPGYWEGE